MHRIPAGGASICRAFHYRGAARVAQGNIW